MKRNCNLDLRLLTPSLSFDFAHSHNNSMLDMEEERPSNCKTQQLTIFYNGKVASCDATEFQARAIISLASGQGEEKSGKTSPSSPAAVAVAMNSPVYSAATGLSMKRSLQRFLEKRKTRAHSISPYQITRRH